MDQLPLITIPALYFIFAFLKPSLQPKLPFNLCALCVAVSLTWFGLLIAWLVGATIATNTLAILMGMSVTGLMYKMETLYQKNKLQHFWWIRLVIVIGGFSEIQQLMKENWNIVLLIAILSLFAIVIPTFLMQEITHDPNSVTKRLDDCC